MTPLEIFTRATIEALYFTDTGAVGQPGAGAELSPETLANLEADCRSFWRRACLYICAALPDLGFAEAASRAGHDFWLTRNGHGAGFWDGDWAEPYGHLLDMLAKSYGEFETYEGDNGKIYA